MRCFVFYDFWVGNLGFFVIYGTKMLYLIYFCIIKYILASFPGSCSLCSNKVDLC